MSGEIRGEDEELRVVEDVSSEVRRSEDHAGAALQVIVLGSGGGPLESNTTALLVRPLASKWGRGSVVALDAGVHLSAIQRILQETQPKGLGESETLSLPYTLRTGPFSGLELPYASPTANAAHIYRSLIDTYLITHPHLDHISGFVVNTAGLPGSRPKRLAGLPSTISAFKTHIFNNVIWPNLSDENNGAGLVTYMRLVEGGSPALGDGDGKGYLEISDGLAVKIWSVSHGHCIERHSHRGSASSSRVGSMDASNVCTSTRSRSLGRHNSSAPNLNVFMHHQQQQQRDQGNLHGGPQGRASSVSTAGLLTATVNEAVCVYDSSAYFIRDVNTGREILVFGDVEPDSISLSPRNLQIWQEAAPKIAAGKLAAIFIECSYDDSQSVDRLFGHLTPRFIIEEMTVLASEVAAAREVLVQEAPEIRLPRSSSERKRKRESGGDVFSSKRKPPAIIATPSGATSAGADDSGPTPESSTDEAVSPKTLQPVDPPSEIPGDSHGGILDSPRLTSSHLATPTTELNLRELEASPPATPLSAEALQPPESSASSASQHTPPFQLRGVKVVVIHVKEKLVDGPRAGDVILSELLKHEREAELGCEFIISSSGLALYL